MTDVNESDRPANPLSWLIVIPIGLAVVGFFVARSLVRPPTIQNSPAIGQPAPELDLVRLTDDLSLDQTVQSVPTGKVVLLHFWGTWCPPCKLEYPHLSEMTAKYRTNQNYEFLSVTCESGPDSTFESLWSKTREYFEVNGIADRVAFSDSRGITRRSLAQRLGRESIGYPTSILIDAQGQIAGVWEGYTTQAVGQMATLTDQLLASVEASN